MKCEFCGKEIYGLTGLREIQKYQKHLRRCRKNNSVHPSDIEGALDSRVRSEDAEDAGADREFWK